MGDDEVAKSRVEATIDLLKRYEKRAERSLFDAADAAQKQIEAESAEKPAEKPAAPAADGKTEKAE